MAQRIIGELLVKIKGDSAELNKTIDQAHTKTQNFASSMNQLGNKLSLFVTAPLVALGTIILKSAADMEMLQASFETMLGSASAASKLMSDLKKMAAATPFATADLASASKMLLQYGVAIEDLIPTMKMLGDISGGDKNRFQSLALVMGQIRALGRLTGQDLRQMIGVGFNPLYTISEKTGESMASLTDKMSKGQITYDQVADAMKSATTEGGKFFGGMERGSKTLSGLLSTLQDDAMEAGRSMLEFVVPVVKDLVKFLSSLFQEINKLDAGTKKTIVIMLGIAAAAGPIMKGITGVINVFGMLKKAMTFMIANPWILILAGIAAAIAVVVSLVDAHQQRFEKQLDVTRETIKLHQEETDAVNGMVNEYKSLSEKTTKTADERARMAWLEYQLAKQLDISAEAITENGIALDVLDGKTEDYNKKRIEQLVKLKENELYILKEQQKKFAEDLKWREDRVKNTLEGIKHLGEKFRAGPFGQTTKEMYDAEVLALAEISVKVGKINLEIQAKEKELADFHLGIVEKFREAPVLVPPEVVKPTTTALDDQAKAWEKLGGAAAKAMDTASGKVEKQKTLIEEYNEYIEKQVQDTLNVINNITSQWAGIINNIIGNLSSIFSQFYSNILQNLTNDYESKKAYIEANVKDEEEKVRQLEALDKEYSEEQKRLKREEWSANKTASIIESIINTALAVTKALTYGPIVGPILAAIVGALGLVQTGLIASQPIPNFATGGLVYPQPGGTIIRVAEAGVPEYQVPDTANIWNQIADRISASMGSTNNYNTNNYNAPEKYSFKISETEFCNFINERSRLGKIRIDPTRGISKR